MNEIAMLRADHYSDGRVVPILITFSDGKSECVSSIKEIRREANGKGCVIRCTTPFRELILCFQNSKWKLTNVEP